MVKPETVGFSSQRLDRLHALIQQEVDQKQLAGAVTILARHGKVVDYRTYGYRDMATGAPMTKDVIFRDYSMTKPVTGVAMMILYEQGKWLPSDPIAKYIPEFAQLKVFQGVDANGKMILVDPDHPPTMRELMSHSAGFSYGSGHTVVDAMYHDQKVMDSPNLQEMIGKLATIPLNYQPGKGWTYSVSMDIEGYIVEKLSGQSLPDFMRDQIFVPLRDERCGLFCSPGETWTLRHKLPRRRPGAACTRPTAGKPSPWSLRPSPPCPRAVAAWFPRPKTTIALHKCWANGGELEGKRILAPATVKLMTSNHLPANLLTGEFGIGQHIMRPGFGYGFNCAVVFDPDDASAARRQRHFLLGRRGRYLVLGGSHQRYCLCLHDSAHGRSRQSQPGIPQPRHGLPGTRRSFEVVAFPPASNLP